MYSEFLLLTVVMATSPVLPSVVKTLINSCSSSEFACGDGACVSFDLLCDGHAQCADGSDEAVCYTGSNNLSPDDTILNRSRRQATCRKNQWQCRDGTCISFDGKCDGVVNCPDGSDETHPLCRKDQCQNNWFRCTYGACVDGTAPCNGVQECADNSDELLPQCRNETAEIRGQFKCQDGSFISAVSHCDGEVDCADGSDETVRACAAKTCPNYLFQCAYGACVDRGADCNNIKECADGSDESNELCNRMLPSTPTVATPSQTGPCILPDYPAHGSYQVDNTPNALPGQGFQAISINVTCKQGYSPVGNTNIYCLMGRWSHKMTECVRSCELISHPSVEYVCTLSGDNVYGVRPCKEFEPTGTVVRPKCRAPNYYSAVDLNYMTCIDGNWDYKPNCIPECGTVTPEGSQLIIDGRLAKRGELPWHAGIYRKTVTPYLQICGGSLVRTTVVLSAAHCFWSDAEKLLPPQVFAVAVGKLYRPWDNPRDVDAQKSDVSDIKITHRFLGSETNFQEDIAIVILSTAFVYKTYVRPVCLDFDERFEDLQLLGGDLGKVAGWGLTAANGNASQTLKTVEIPFVEVRICLANAPPGFREYITSDKICAGFGNGTALCQGDSGGGLVFPYDDRRNKRYYLRGVVSTAPRNENACNAFTFTAFTQISKHETFIKQNLPVD